MCPTAASGGRAALGARATCGARDLLHPAVPPPEAGASGSRGDARWCGVPCGSHFAARASRRWGALAASEPSFNGSGLDAPFAERTRPAAYLPPIERGALDVAVSRAALRRLSRVLGVRPAAAFRYSSACHMTVVE